MFEELNNLPVEEKKILWKFWQAWRAIRNDTGFGEVKMTMQKKKLRHVLKTASEIENDEKIAS